MAVVLFLVVLLIPVLPRKNTTSSRITCVSHLKQVGLAFRMWSNDHGDKFPWDVAAIATNGPGTKEFAASAEVWRHFQVISNELNTPRILVCPHDKERNKVTDFAALNNSHISYFIGLSADETKPQTILSGDRNLTAGGKLLQGTISLSTNAVLGWTSFHHIDSGNIALADGSAIQTTPESVNKQLQSAFLSTTQSVLRFAFPQ